jgi:hypothetical protein
VDFDAPRAAAVVRTGPPGTERTGPQDVCQTAFLEREQRTGRGLDANRWLRNNKKALELYETSAYEDYRVQAFQPDGKTRWPRDYLVQRVRDELGVVQS